VEFRTVLHCSKCRQPIVSGQGFGFVCFKIPGKEGYQFFHCRFRTGDCWDGYLEGTQHETSRNWRIRSWEPI
jgi:hypothetical protein